VSNGKTARIGRRRARLVHSAKAPKGRQGWLENTSSEPRRPYLHMQPQHVGDAPDTDDSSTEVHGHHNLVCEVYSVDAVPAPAPALYHSAAERTYVRRSRTVPSTS